MNTQVASENFWSIATKYIQPGSCVAELYHGVRLDILAGMSRLVGEAGVVYGIDRLNPFGWFEHMRSLAEIPNIRLIAAEIPPLPAELRGLNAIVVREFWFLKSTGEDKPIIYRDIQNAVKPGGYLIFHLNETEQEGERTDRVCQGIVQQNMPRFSLIAREGEALVYKKPLMW